MEWDKLFQSISMVLRMAASFDPRFKLGAEIFMIGVAVVKNLVKSEGKEITELTLDEMADNIAKIQRRNVDDLIAEGIRRSEGK